MIRLMDTEAYSIEKDDICREKLFSHFCSKGHNEDFILVYDNSIYVGYICYQSLLSTVTVGNDGYLVTERYIHRLNDWHIWENLKDMFRNNKTLKYIPICNENGDLLYFAYTDTVGGVMVEPVLQGWLQEGDGTWLKEKFPQMKKVRIYDLNEYGEMLYRILKKCNLRVEIAGEAWGVLFPEYQSDEEYVPEGNIFKVYADGAGYLEIGKNEIANSSWVFAEVMGREKSTQVTARFKKYFAEKRVKFFTGFLAAGNMKSPWKTVDECYRAQAVIEPYMSQSMWRQECAKKQIDKVTGYETTYEMWDAAEKAREYEDYRIAGKIIPKKQFGRGKNHIYVVGPCIVMGQMALTVQESFLACLYRSVTKISEEFSIVGLAFRITDFYTYNAVLESLSVTENDIVVAIESNPIGGWKYDDLKLQELLDTRQCDWFYDMPVHTNYIGNVNLAEHIVNNFLKPMITNIKKKPCYLQCGSYRLSQEEQGQISAYLESIGIKKTVAKAGAIVMNCNPMTRGHLYLIKQASQRVERVYIFVVQEDKSEIPFEIRIEIVKRQIKAEGLDNVVVIPFGEFVLSYKTMPLYFEKEIKKDAKLDATGDLQIFGEYIAPELGIVTRFVGEEPTDMVTKQYNEAMKQLLPYYGIQVIEIPRLEKDEEFISASKVRKAIHENDWDKVKQLVPEESYKELKKLFAAR